MHGLNDIKELCFLQVHGQSQLSKEVQETKHLPNKYYDFDALHRNE